MLKKIITQTQNEKTFKNEEWLDLEKLAEVEITSEDSSYPIEEALKIIEGKGWRASKPGEQTIRLIFSNPVKINHIQILFQEKEKERTQQFILKWLADKENNFRQIVCQQFNFSPSGSISEIEDYEVVLNNLKILELQIIPDISNENTYASLNKLLLS